MLDYSFGGGAFSGVGAVLLSVASVAALKVDTIPQIAAVLVLAGLGNAAQSAAALPLMTQLIPADEVGFYVGLQTMAPSLTS